MTDKEQIAEISRQFINLKHNPPIPDGPNDYSLNWEPTVIDVYGEKLCVSFFNHRSKRTVHVCLHPTKLVIMPYFMPFV